MCIELSTLVVGVVIVFSIEMVIFMGMLFLGRRKRQARPKKL